MRISTLISASLVLACFALWPSRACAETTIKLKSGQVFCGHVVGETGNFIILDSDGKQVRILRAIIAEINGRPIDGAVEEAGREPDSQPATPAHADAPPPDPQPLPTPAPAAQTPPQARPRTFADYYTTPQPAPTPPEPPASPVPEATPTPSDTPAPAPAPGPPTEAAAAPTPPPAATPAATPAPAAPPPAPEPVDLPEEVVLEVPASLQKLVDQLDEPDPEEQVAAALALARKGPQAASAVPFLIRRFRNTETVRRGRSSGRGGSAGSDSAMSPARAAGVALVAIGEPAVPALVRSLHHNEAPIRAGACRALGELKHAAGTDQLMRALKDEDERVRAAAAEALGNVREPRAIPLLLTMYSGDESGAARQSAEKALKKVTEIPLLIEGLKEPHPLVQDNSAYILFLMTTKEFKKDVAAWETWWKEQEGSKEPSFTW